MGRLRKLCRETLRLSELPLRESIAATGCLVLLAAAVAADESPLGESRVDAFKVVGEVVKVQGGFEFVEGPTMAADGAVYFTDIPANQILVWKAGEKAKRWLEPSMHANGLLAEAGGKLVACQMDGRVVAYDLGSKQETVLADSYNGRRFNAPNDLVIDQVGGVYFTDPLYRAPQPLPQDIQAVYYIAVDGSVTRVSDALPAPNGIGLSPDGKSLYVIPSMSAEMLVYDVIAPGKLSEPRIFCNLKQRNQTDNSGGDGMAVDTRGNLFITSNLGVQVFAANGSWLETIKFPEQPANVSFAGPERRMLVVTARTGLYTVEVSTSGLQAGHLRVAP